MQIWIEKISWSDLFLHQWQKLHFNWMYWVFMKAPGPAVTGRRCDHPFRGLIWVRPLCGRWQSARLDSSAGTRSERLSAELQLQDFQKFRFIQPHHPLWASQAPLCSFTEQWKNPIVCVILQNGPNSEQRRLNCSEGSLKNLGIRFMVVRIQHDLCIMWLRPAGINTLHPAPGRLLLPYFQCDGRDYLCVETCGCPYMPFWGLQSLASPCETPTEDTRVSIS